MQHLMEITQGRMQGIMLYRRESSTRWHKAFCAIDAIEGKLYRENPKVHKATTKPHSKLPLDLRGCTARLHREEGSPRLLLELVTLSSPTPLQLTTENEAELERWQAAFLCWQPLRDRQIIGPVSDGVILQPCSTQAMPELSASARIAKTGKPPAIQRAARLMLWCEDSPKADPEDTEQTKQREPSWVQVSCVIKNNGEFVAATVDDGRTLATLYLSNLSRSAVQRLHSSACGQDYCLAIIPQHSRFTWDTYRLRPVFLSCATRDSYEAWLVLLTEFTVPEVYCPPKHSSVDILRPRQTLPGLAPTNKVPHCRVERYLKMYIGHLEDNRPPTAPGQNGLRCASMTVSAHPAYSLEYQIETFLEGNLIARTKSKPSMAEIVFLEEVELVCVPSRATFIGFRVVQVWRLAGATAPNGAKLGDGAEDERPTVGPEIDRRVVAEATSTIDEISAKQMQGSTQLTLRDGNGVRFGVLGVKAFCQQQVTLMDSEYAGTLSPLLHNFSNNVTLEIADRAFHELAKLARLLMNIYQVSGTVGDWMMALAEEEVDGIRKEAPSQRYHFRSRLGSTESKESLAAYGPNHARVDLVQNLNRTATAEANLLFRGNTLFSKALDLHMHRLCKDYLIDTLGDKMRSIIDDDVDLELDPARASATASLSYNTVKLLGTAQEVWNRIYHSAAKCPMEIRVILRHIKACADDRFGEVLRNAPYSAVSGFIFLRFFCPALLNPPIFGLYHGTCSVPAEFAGLLTFTVEALHPRVQRNCLLITKCIQTLANQATFGNKEPWMEPMNDFIHKNRQHFKTFIDKLCDVAHQYPSFTVRHGHMPAQQVFTKLPPLVQEGIPALPFLIDSSRSFAGLVRTWLTSKPTVPHNNHYLLKFHTECLRIDKLSQECFDRAEGSGLVGIEPVDAWSAIAARMKTHPTDFWDSGAGLSMIRSNASDPSAVQQRTIEFAPDYRRTMSMLNEGSGSRPSTSPARTDRDSISRGLRNLRFRSRSRSRPSSRQQMINEAAETSDDDYNLTGPSALQDSSANGRYKERPPTADRTGKRFWQRKDTERTYTMG